MALERSARAGNGYRAAIATRAEQSDVRWGPRFCSTVPVQDPPSLLHPISFWPSQWEAHASFSAGIGPDAFWFLRNFRKQFRRKPEYTAAGSFAVGLIFKECVRRAGSLQDNNLLATAAELDGYTFYGRFRLDSASRRQVGHRILLIQWVRDHKVLLPTGNIE